MTHLHPFCCYRNSLLWCYSCLLSYKPPVIVCVINIHRSFFLGLFQIEFSLRYIYWNTRKMRRHVAALSIYPVWLLLHMCKRHGLLEVSIISTGLYYNIKSAIFWRALQHGSPALQLIQPPSVFHNHLSLGSQGSSWHWVKVRLQSGQGAVHDRADTNNPSDSQFSESPINTGCCEPITN